MTAGFAKLLRDRGYREEMLKASLRLDTEEEKPKWDAPHNPCEVLIAARFGVSNSVAQSIISYRDMKVVLSSRTDLLALPRLGDETFEQAASFLRVMNGDNSLDVSAVHQESYPVVQKILADISRDVKNVIGEGKLLKSLNASKYAEDKFGVPTVTD